MFKKVWLFIAAIGMFAVLQCAQTQAQTCAAAGPPCVYSVKFICGEQSANPNLHPPSEPPVKPGNYATSINIHNFHNEGVSISKTAVIANPESQAFGQISQPHPPVNLGPGRAFEIDCSDIVTLFSPPPPAPPPSLPAFIKGFVVLRASTGVLPVLSVTAVYTAQPATAGAPPSGPVSIEVVPVQPFAGP